MSPYGLDGQPSSEETLPKDVWTIAGEDKKGDPTDDESRSFIDKIKQKYLSLLGDIDYSLEVMKEISLPDLLNRVWYVVYQDDYANPLTKLQDNLGLRFLSGLTEEDMDLIIKELNYLKGSFPKLESREDVYPAVMASILLMSNMALSSTVRGVSTAYVGNLALREDDPTLKTIYTALFSYISLTNAFVPLPSLPGLSNFISFNFIEVPILMAFRNWYWKHNGRDQRVDTEVVIKEFLKVFSIPRSILNFEFIGSIMLLNLEFLRAYGLEEVSPKTIFFLTVMKKFKRLFN